MKKILLATVSLLFTVSAAQAEGFYISAGTGININGSSAKTLTGNGEIKNRYDNSPIYNVALGYDLPFLPLRIEAEGLRTTADVKTPINVGGTWLQGKETMTVNALMANAYVRIPLIGLYAGAGIGYGKVKGEKTPLYQGMVGVEYPIFVLPLHIGVEYRHTRSAKDFNEITSFNSFDDFTSAKSTFKADAIMVKARIDF